MRKSVGTVEEFANITWPANANATLSFSLQFIASSLGGIPANLLVLYITFFCKEIAGNYKYFLANLAICDLCSCFSALFQLCYHLYHLLGDVPLNITSCYIMTFPSYMFGLSMAATLPLASINRYFVICRGGDKWFTGKRISLLCAAAYFPIIYPITDFLFAHRVVYYCNLCAYNFSVPFNPEWIIIVVFPIAYLSLIFCNVSIYKKLAKHVHSTQQLLGKEIQMERSILKALVIQTKIIKFGLRRCQDIAVRIEGIIFTRAVCDAAGYGKAREPAAIPPILIAPMAIAITIVGVNGFDEDTILKFVIIRFGQNAELTVLDLCFISYNLNQMLDALATLIVVRPYWTATKNILSNVKRIFVGDKNSVTSLSSNLSKINSQNRN